ncbi:MAG: 3-phosphoshikimate 1-carboxyvinyltransferase [Phycisphaeraceae bacterium]|nr:3-phosphoshikimate 1-carboxyvinyltransferase [Phycisphaeraceae bacterium]
MKPTPLDILSGPLAGLPESITLGPVEGPIDAVVTPPGSKSLANRALTLALLGCGESTISNVPDEADDIRVMLRALPQLGARVERLAAGIYRIGGTHGRPSGGAQINLHNAGTATRFLTAACALASAPVAIDGDDRMRQRPIGELIDALLSIGAAAEYLGAPGFPPVRVGGSDPHDWSGEVTFATTASSQFISAMLLIAPFCPSGLSVNCRGEITSQPYVRMTEAMVESLNTHNPTLGEFAIEPDASGAAPFIAARAIVPGSRIDIPGINAGSLQGDAAFAGLIESITRDHHVSAFDIDLSDMPDTAMTLAVVACFAKGASTIRGLRTLRVKETDRIAALQNELAKVGVTVEVFAHESAGGNPDEGIRVTPPAGGIDCSAGAPPVAFDTYDDHRMAMALVLIGLRRPNVTINDPACVAKTYPGFWRDFASLHRR